MKIFFTAEYDEEQLKPLYEIGEVVKDGWACKDGRRGADGKISRCRYYYHKL